MAKKLIVAHHRGRSQPAFVAKMSEESRRLIAEREGPTPSGLSELRHYQPQHLLDRAAHRIDHALSSPLCGVVLAPLANPFISEAGDVRGKIRPSLSPMRLGVRSEPQEYRNAAKHVAGGVAPVVHPYDVTLN